MSAPDTYWATAKAMETVNGPRTNEETEDLIIGFIRSFAAREGYPPTVRAIGLYIGLTPSPTHRHLDHLVASGRLRRVPTCPRAIEVVK